MSEVSTRPSLDKLWPRHSYRLVKSWTWRSPNQMPPLRQTCTGVLDTLSSRSLKMRKRPSTTWMAANSSDAPSRWLLRNRKRIATKGWAARLRYGSRYAQDYDFSWLEQKNQSQLTTHGCTGGLLGQIRRQWGRQACNRPVTVGNKRESSGPYGRAGAAGCCRSEAWMNNDRHWRINAQKDEKKHHHIPPFTSRTIYTSSNVELGPFFVHLLSFLPQPQNTFRDNT